MEIIKVTINISDIDPHRIDGGAESIAVGLGHHYSECSRGTYQMRLHILLADIDVLCAEYKVVCRIVNRIDRYFPQSQGGSLQFFSDD